MRESAALLGASLGRLIVLYLLIFLFTLFLGHLAYIALPLSATLTTLGNAGFYCALETTRQGRAPSFVDMVYPWRLPTEKLVLVVACGMIPLIVGLLTWWIDVGPDRLVELLTTSDAISKATLAERVEFDVVREIAAVPLFFVLPFCVLYSWSASRTVSANVLASVANWRWLFAYCAFASAVDVALNLLDMPNLAILLGVIVTTTALNMFSDAFTLVLMLRSLHD